MEDSPRFVHAARRVLSLLVLTSIAFPVASSSSGVPSQLSAFENPPGLAESTVPHSISPSPGMGSPALGRTTGILLAGGIASLLSWQHENPDEAVRVLEGSFLETPIDVGDLYANGLVIGGGALGAMAVGRLTGQPKLRKMGDDLSQSLIVTSAVVWSLKLSLNRTRPNGADHSFPSGHTAVAFCAAPVLQKHFGWKVGVPAYALAVSAGLGRMEDRKHYLSDVFLGAAIGMAVGDAVVHPGFGRSLRERLKVGPRSLGVQFKF